MRLLGLVLAGLLLTTTPALAQKTAFDITKPAFVPEDTVLCPDTAVLGAYVDGQQAGGKDEGGRRVQQLFVHPDLGCVRTFGRAAVRVIDKEVTGTQLVTVEWLHKEMLVQPTALRN